MEPVELERLLMKPTARRRLGKYVLLGRLGHGGMGKIYLAFMPGPAGIEKLLVIKRLHSHLTSDEILVASFLDEARLSMSLTHPNIVHTYDVGEVEGRYFMVMEHIDGQNLGVLLRTAKRSGNYPSSEVWAGMFMQVLDGLDAAHRAHDARGRALNIIHRDISPQNILVTYEGTPKVVDFGIAKAAMRINETDAGVLKGKYAYMSPEQCEGNDLDPRSDIFSAAIVLWEMLAGRRLYKSDSVLRSVERILHEPPLSPVKVNADCDPGIARVVVKGLQKKRQQRFKSAEEFRDALEEALRQKGARFKNAHVRTLMQSCFGDVMVQQRKVLDRCLAGDFPALDPGDSESGHQGPANFDGDSESDLAVRARSSPGELEPTTPSNVQPSPLITNEDATQDGPALGDDGGAPATRRMRPDAIKVKAAQAPTAAFVVPDVRAPETQARRPVAAALLLFVLVASVAGAYWSGAADVVLASLGASGADQKSDSPSSSTSSKASTEVKKRDASDTGQVRGDGSEPEAKKRDREAGDRADRNPANRNPAGRNPAGNERATKAEQKNLARADPSGTAKNAATGRVNEQKTRDRRRDRRRARRSRRDDGRVAKRPSESAREASLGDGSTAPAGRDDSTGKRPEGTKPEKEMASNRSVVETSSRPKPKLDKARPDKGKGGTGKLTLSTSPWVTVFLNGKKLGNTPLVNYSLRAGEVTLRLKNEEEGIDQSYFLIIKPGKTTIKKLGLK